MHRTTKGYVVVRVAVPNEVWEEINNVANSEGITYNQKVKHLLKGWAYKRVNKRVEGDKLDEHFNNLRALSEDV